MSLLFCEINLYWRRLKDGSLVYEPDVERAEFHLRRAIEINEKYDKAYFKLALLLRDQKNYIESFNNFEHALQINPSFLKLTIKWLFFLWTITLPRLLI